MLIHVTNFQRKILDKFHVSWRRFSRLFCTFFFLFVLGAVFFLLKWEMGFRMTESSGFGFPFSRYPIVCGYRPTRYRPWLVPVDVFLVKRGNTEDSHARLGTPRITCSTSPNFVSSFFFSPGCAFLRKYISENAASLRNLLSPANFVESTGRCICVRKKWRTCEDAKKYEN